MLMPRYPTEDMTIGFRGDWKIGSVALRYGSLLSHPHANLHVDREEQFDLARLQGEAVRSSFSSTRV
jgi:hypothetical protein